MNKRVFQIIALILGISMIIMGIVFLAAPADYKTGDHAEYASFGADFYTYQYKASRIVADNVADAAYNVQCLSRAIATYVGLAFICAGVFLTIFQLDKLSRKQITDMVPSQIIGLLHDIKQVAAMRANNAQETEQPSDKDEPTVE